MTTELRKVPNVSGANLVMMLGAAENAQEIQERSAARKALRKLGLNMASARRELEQREKHGIDPNLRPQ